MVALRAWLRTAREAQGLSMRDLADRMDKAHNYVQRVEEGERRLDVVEFVWYCRALGLDPNEGFAIVTTFVTSNWVHGRLSMQCYVSKNNLNHTRPAPLVMTVWLLDDFPGEIKA